MQRKIEMLQRKFKALGHALNEFNMFLRDEDYKYTLTDGTYFFYQTTDIENELAKAPISEEIKKKLNICALLITEAGIMSWYLFYKDSDNLRDVEALIQQGKAIIRKEKKLGLDREPHAKDYDVLLNIKRNKAKEYMKPTIRAMTKDISDAYFSFFSEAEKELNAL